ncbi:DUF2946 family protein [Falsiroseomonas selenitidurans]|uniref:DUF2946 family protein n=1 Tax=Falsiroseomonas selenitidurans TaxID=2716335 RepID=A0ABX1EB07_9PROT|nr:DUF2946 family protein [Falsiroseomonas selenitidurans]NKC34424.1 DUF2946 family protein [Falsiroseomonas selenitidurans]
MRLRPALTKLVVLLLLLQWGTAFGHCLRMASPDGAHHAGLDIPICTPDGIRQLSLAEVFQPDGTQPPADHPAAQMLCPVCSGVGAATTPPPAVGLLPPLLLVQTPAPPPPSTPNPAPPPRCQPPPRAPPTS